MVNYDNFYLAPRFRDTFFKMVEHHEGSCFLSSARYSTDTFFRHQLGEEFVKADLGQRTYRDFDEAHRSFKVSDL